MAVSPALSAEVLRTLESIPDAYLVLAPGPTFTILTATNAYLRSTGTTRPALQGRPLFEAFPDYPFPGAAGKQVLLASLQQVLHTGQPHRLPLQRYEEPCRSGGFQEQYWDILNTPVLTADGGAVEYVLHRAERAPAPAAAKPAPPLPLLQREALYQLFENTPALICILRGPDHRLEYCNASFQQLYAGRDIVGRPVAETQPEAVAQGFVALLDDIYQSGTPVCLTDVLGRVQAPNGQWEERYFHFTYQTYQEQGVTAGVAVFAFEVTDRVRARQQYEAGQAELAAQAQRLLQQQQQVLQEVLAHTPALIGLTQGATHHIVYANTASQRLFPDRQLVGQPAAAAVPEAVEAGMLALLDTAYHTGAPITRLEMPLHLPDGKGRTPRYFTVACQPYREGTGVGGVACVAIDVTEQVLARRPPPA